MKKIYFVGLMCAMIAMSGCQKRYVSPLEAPNMTKAPEDQPYDFDFDQVNNDVVDSLQDKEIYGFVKDLSVSGDNEKKKFVLEADIMEDVSYEAVEYFLADATKAIVDAAHLQDFRIDEWNEEGYGNLFEKYAYRYKVTCGKEIIREESLNAGDSVPFDPAMSIEQVTG